MGDPAELNVDRIDLVSPDITRSEESARDDSGDDFVDIWSKKKTKRKYVTHESTSRKRKGAVEEKEIDDVEGTMSKIPNKSRNTRGKLVGYKKLVTRTTPHEFVQAISLLNNQQRKIVREMGFEHILELKITELPLYLCHWLVQSYDARKGILKMADGEVMCVTEQDVHICFGIPIGGNTLIVKGRGEDDDVLEEWRNQFKGKSDHQIRPSDVAREMLNCIDGGKHFIQNFVVLFHSCLVESHQSGVANQNLVKSICGKPTGIKGFNWCEFVMDTLINARKKLDEKPNTVFRGSTLFLVLLYYDRVINYNKRLVPRSFPILSGWETSHIRDREFSEMQVGGFGKGKLVDQVVMPATEQCFAKVYNLTNLSKDICQLTTVEDWIKLYAERTNQLEESIMEMCNWCSLTPSRFMRVPEINTHQDLARSLMGIMADKTKKKTLEDASPLERSLYHTKDRSWNDPKVYQCGEAMHVPVTKGYGLKKKSEFPSFDLLSYDDDEGRNDMESVPQNSAGFFNQPNSDAGNVCSSVNANTRYSVEKVVDHGSKNHEDVDERSVPSKSVVTSFGLHMLDVYKGQKKIQKTTGVQTINGRERKLGEHVISPFYDRETNLGVRSSIEQQNMTCFVQDGLRDDNKVMFRYSGNVLIRSDLVSIHRTNHITVNVIDVWAILLNDLERHRSKDSPRRFFSTTETTLHTVVQEAWPDYDKRFSVFEERLDRLIALSPHKSVKNIDLFMFPIYKFAHYYVICFNMKTYEVEIIDNSPSTVYEYDKKLIPGSLKILFLDYLDKHGENVKAHHLDQKLNHKVLEMEWRDDNNMYDCGIYAMRHMETYRGQNEKDWDCGFKKNTRKSTGPLRIKYHHAILTSKLNELRELIIKDAKAFKHAKSADS